MPEPLTREALFEMVEGRSSCPGFNGGYCRKCCAGIAFDAITRFCEGLPWEVWSFTTWTSPTDRFVRYEEATAALERLKP